MRVIAKCFTRRSRVMKHIAHIGFAIAGLVLSPIGHADDATDATITVVVESDTPEDVAKTVPDAASDTADERAAFGLDVAGQAQDQARDLGREFGQSMSEQARDARVGAANANAASHRP
jgi:hypothetical protein